MNNAKDQTGTEQLAPSQATTPKRKSNKLIMILAVVVCLVILFLAELLLLNRTSTPATESTVSNNKNISTDNTQSQSVYWKTYHSVLEKINFQYPSNWTVTTSVVELTDPKGDHISITSPSGEITVSWASGLSGFGGACDETKPLNSPDKDNCPLITILDKTPITGATGLDVMSGTITGDGKEYEPWVAVLNSNYNDNLGFGMFHGHNTPNGEDSVFSTADVTLTGPKLSQADALAYFNKPEVKTVKQILLSLSY